MAMWADDRPGDAGRIGESAACIRLSDVVQLTANHSLPDVRHSPSSNAADPKASLSAWSTSSPTGSATAGCRRAPSCATEAALMGEFGVSRTVIARGAVQDAGLLPGRDAARRRHLRHRPGRLGRCSGSAATSSPPCATWSPMLELRIGVETEAAGLAAQRRTAANLETMRQALNAFTQAVEAGSDAVGADFRFHLEITRATQNAHFESLVQTLGTAIIPRARLDPSAASADERQAYLRRVNAEHGSILDAHRQPRQRSGAAAMRTHLAEQPRAPPPRPASFDPRAAVALVVRQLRRTDLKHLVRRALVAGLALALAAPAALRPGLAGQARSGSSCPTPPGGSSDIIARAISSRCRRRSSRR